MKFPKEKPPLRFVPCFRERSEALTFLRRAHAQGKEGHLMPMKNDTVFGVYLLWPEGWDQRQARDFVRKLMREGDSHRT